MVSDNLIWGGLGAFAVLGIVSEVTSLGLPGWTDSLFEIPFDLILVGVGLWGWMA